MELEQTEKTDAAAFSLNKSFSLSGVLCAAEVFVVPRAFDKASCSSLAKSGTSPQGPQVGVDSPAALCAHFIMWIQTHTNIYRERERHADILTHIEVQFIHTSTSRGPTGLGVVFP